MYTLQSFEDKANSITEDTIKVLSFNGVKSPVCFVCLKCGEEQEVARGEVLLRKGKNYQCQFCHYTKEKSNQEKRHKIENLATKLDIEVIDFTKVGEKVTFRCKKCGNTFERTSGDFLRSQKCPYCNPQVLPYEIFITDLQKTHGNEYTIMNPEKYKDTRSYMMVKHSCGFIWKTTPHNLLHHSCPKCSKKTSKGEKAIRKYLDDNNIEYVWQWAKKIEDKTLFFDFYLPDFNLAIEFQGEQHYVPVEYWGGEDGLIKRQYNDNLKRQWCKEQGIILLEIPFSQFDNINGILASSTTIPNGSTPK